MGEKLIQQEYVVTSPLNKELMLEAFHAQLSSTIFRELINNEKPGLKVTFTVEEIEAPDTLNTETGEADG